MEAKDWKLFRCIYDEMGQHAIEGEGDYNQFEKCVAKGYGEIRWVLGQPIPLNNYIAVKVILEGNKEVLEYVLELIQKETH